MYETSFLVVSRLCLQPLKVNFSQQVPSYRPMTVTDRHTGEPVTVRAVYYQLKTISITINTRFELDLAVLPSARTQTQIQSQAHAHAHTHTSSADALDSMFALCPTCWLLSRTDHAHARAHTPSFAEFDALGYQRFHVAISVDRERYLSGMLLFASLAIMRCRPPLCCLCGICLSLCLNVRYALCFLFLHVVYVQ